MFRKRVFWILFSLVSLLAIAFTVRNFSAGFPLVSVDVRMDRDGALNQARSLAERNAWPPAGFDQAVSFGGEPEVQNFVELEGGGKEELSRILSQGLYATYKWHVRHFKEGDAHETLISFAPEGRPYGFAVKLPEQEPGASLEAGAARELAEAAAASDWDVDFSRYLLAESSREVQPGGRADHTFVYERQDERAGEGRYRLRLVIGGDKLTELTRFVQIPEAFSRRYEEMRSANDSISVAANLAMLALYVLGGCGVGLFFMMRQRWVEWRQPLIWAVVIAGLAGSEVLNRWPLIWMEYDTALPAGGFAIRQIATAIASFLAMAVLLAVSFAAAETLSRRAFPQHIQLWRIWSTPAAASRQLLGQTAGAYLLIGIFFAYEVVLYVFAHGRLGWWTPSDTLANPDVFAAYLPSLSAVALSAQAGFWEECLFRAVPLAAAALVGDKFGARRGFIIGAMVIQALVFGAGHAGYANQPAYARVLELIIPSFAFGALYLAFGLLPGIILHYGFDLVWFSLPIFLSSAPRALFEQVIVIALGLIPLWIVLARRLKMRRWVETPQESLNSAWLPRPAADVPATAVYERPDARPVPVHVWRWIPAAGLAGLIMWAAASDFTSGAPPISISRAEAESKARQALAESGVSLDPSWRVLSSVVSQPGQQHRFVWQKAGREKFNELLGAYLPAPYWHVRFARFEGDVAARAEEHAVHVSGAGNIIDVRHQLPEAAPGPSLTQEEARQLARDKVIRSFQFPQENLKEISAEASKRPARGDWSFVFSDTRDYGLTEGEPRMTVSIAGDKVVAASRYIYVPEEWARNERAQRNIPTLLNVVCTGGIVAIVLGGAIAAIIRWSGKKPFPVRTFVRFLTVLFLLSTIGLVNRWPDIAAQLSTAQPFMLQAGIALAVSVVFALCVAAAFAFAAGLVLANPQPRPEVSAGRSALLGASFGAFAAGAGALASLAASSAGPQWTGYNSAGSLIPLLSVITAPLNDLLTQTLLLWLIMYYAGRFGRVPPVLTLVLAGLIIAGSSSIETIPSWLLSGLAIGAVLAAGYTLLLKYHPSLLAFAAGAMVVLASLRDGIRQTYPSMLPGTVVAVILTGLAAWFWFRKVYRDASRDEALQSAAVL